MIRTTSIKELGWSQVLLKPMPPKTNDEVIGRHIDTHFLYEMHAKLTKEFGTKLKTKLFSQHEPYSIQKNLFPYNLKPGIKHYLMWINPKYLKFYSSGNNESRVFNILYQHFKGKPFVYFVNIPHFISVPEIKHYHIIVNEIL